MAPLIGELRVENRFDLKVFVTAQWLDPSESSFEDFCDFAEKHGQFLVKPVQGSHGLGIRIESIDQGSDLEVLFKTLQSEQMLLEELIAQ